MAGHSKWANIKHRKGRQDALRGKMNTKLIREITVASKESGPDPHSNPRLRLAIDKANRANVTKDSIKKAIDKGQGASSGADYIEVMYEGYGAKGVAVMVRCLTDNKNRTVSEVRHAFNKHGGNLGTDGSVSYLFERKGVVFLPCHASDQPAMLEAVLDFAVEDVQELEEGLELIVQASDLTSVVDSITAKQWDIGQADLRWVAGTLVELNDEDAQKLATLEDALDDLDDVQEVYHNAQLI